MSSRIWALAVLAAGGCFANAGQASARNQDVTIEIIDAQGRSFDVFPVTSRGDAMRAYLKAERGSPYRIRLRNCTGGRVAAVVAVDGRNIISGARSELARGEPMYVLGPYETQEYSGWRTSMSDVHEFYFTDWKDSYAEAFGDRSARGVIAMAVYREQQRVMQLPGERPYAKDEAARAGAPAPAAGELSANRAESKAAEPGTGFGERRYEPTVRVEFAAERAPSARVFLKYEWAETLCRKGVIDCGAERNRFWDGDLAFAPFPPRR
jgi:hypothetical protein